MIVSRLVRNNADTVWAANELDRRKFIYPKRLTPIKAVAVRGAMKPNRNSKIVFAFDSIVEKRAKDLMRLGKRPLSQFFRLYNSPLREAIVDLASKSCTVADIGCGDGEYTCLVASQPNIMTVIGVDVSLISIKLAKNRTSTSLSVKNKIEFVVGDAKALPVRHRVLDAAISVGLLHHLSNFLVLDEINKVIKKDGWLLIHEVVSNNLLVSSAIRVLKLLPLRYRRCILDVGAGGEIPQVYEFTASSLRKELQKRFVVRSEDREQLFVIFIWYLCMLFPNLGRLVRIPFLNSLYKIERWLIKRTVARELCRLVRFLCKQV